MKPPAGCPLTERDFDTAVLACRGYRHHKIGRVLDVPRSTVSTRLKRAREALGAGSEVELAAVMRDSGWVDPHVSPFDDTAPLSPGQRLYVQAFEEFLRSHRLGPAGEARAWLKKDHMLTAMFLESGVRRAA